MNVESSRGNLIEEVETESRQEEDAGPSESIGNMNTETEAIKE